VKPGAADRSYGIQVARLAGLPRPVTKRAAEVLARLERPGERDRRGAALDELPLFAASSRPDPIDPDAPLAAALAGLNPDELTPKAALEALYRLKALKPNSRQENGA